jgi:hypothetical protein
MKKGSDNHPVTYHEVIHLKGFIDWFLRRQAGVFEPRDDLSLLRLEEAEWDL